jgi:hypothetical protein
MQLPPRRSNFEAGKLLEIGTINDLKGGAGEEPLFGEFMMTTS